MTALCDRPNLTARALYDLLSLALPQLEIMAPCLAMIDGSFVYRTSFKKYNDELFVFFTYHPNASQANRWSVAHEGKIGAPWSSSPLFQKRISKRFASLVDAITYYETEIRS